MARIGELKITICDNCPCLNTDYESGSSCNLEYETDLFWFSKKDNQITEDNPEMRSHQQDFDLKNASMNCELIKIITKKKTIKPFALTRMGGR